MTKRARPAVVPTVLVAPMALGWPAIYWLSQTKKEVHYEFGTFVNQTRGVIDAFTIGADGYSSATFADQVLPVSYGFPMKLRSPPKLGFKNPKHIMAIYVTSTYPGGYWEDQGYNWFSGSWSMDAHTNFKVLPVTSALIILWALTGSAYAASPTEKGAPGAEDDTAISNTVVVQPLRMHETHAWWDEERRHDERGGDERGKREGQGNERRAAKGRGTMDRSNRESKPKEQAP